MKDRIVHSSEAVTLLGGGVVGESDLDLALARAPTLVAADGGARVALAAGHMPQAVIGDFDSLTKADQLQIPPDRLFPIGEQDSTDFDKALRSINAPLILAVGFLGARIDHQLAAFNTLVRHKDRPCLLLGADEIVCHVPPRLTVALEPGAVVSLFPMARLSGISRGLEWPIDGLEFAPDGRVGTSNRAQGPVTIEPSGAGLLMIVPRSALDQLMPAIAPAWSAPAGPH